MSTCACALSGAGVITGVDKSAESSLRLQENSAVKGSVGMDAAAV